MRVWHLLLGVMLANCFSFSHARNLNNDESSSPIIYATYERNDPALTLQGFRVSDGAALGDVLVGADQNTLKRAPAVSFRGFCFKEESLYLVDQRADQPTNGAVHKYAKRVQRGVTKYERRDDFIGISAPNGPFAPVDVLVRKDIAYVIDIGDFDLDGRIALFDLRSRKFVGDLPLTDLATYLPSNGFHPTGAVFGPDDELYVTARSLADPTRGFVFKWDTKNNDQNKWVVFMQDSQDPENLLSKLHRPDSPRFGPDGTFTVNSFRKDGNDLDKILVFPPKRRGEPYAIEIPHTAPNDGRVYSQESVFGPGGKLYVGTNIGEIRAYSVPSTDKRYKVVVPADASYPLLRNIGFEKTDCATLAYRG